MTYHPSLPWPQIHEYLLSIGQTGQPLGLCRTAIQELDRLISYDAAYLFLLSEQVQLTDYAYIGVSEEKVRQFLDYYVTIDPCKQRTPPDAKTWAIDWEEFRHTEFSTDWSRQVDIQFTLSMYLHNQKQTPGAILFISRSGHKGFNDRELSLWEVIQPHISNHFKLVDRLKPVIAHQINDSRLTKRENEIAALLCQGLSTSEIGMLLVISEFTVYRHVYNIFAKIKVANRTELVAKLLGPAAQIRQPDISRHSWQLPVRDEQREEPEVMVQGEKIILNFQTLGPFRAFNQDGTIPVGIQWRTFKTRDLLAFLLHQRGPVSEEVILEELWADDEFDKAKRLFHTSLYFLRRTLKPFTNDDPIKYRNNCYELTDLLRKSHDRFLDLAALQFSEDITAENRVSQLETAVALYQGDYLEELDYTWVLPVRENMKQLFCGACLWLVRHYLAGQQYQLALNHLQRLIAVDLFNEEPRRLLMETYAKLGNTGAIYAEYLRWQELLKQELGLAPSRETRELYDCLVQKIED